MQKYDIDKTFYSQVKVTKKTVAVMKMFGLDLERLRVKAFTHKCRVTLNDGDICYIVGASGAGKSVILREIYSQTPENERVRLDDIELEDDRSVVDCIDGSFFESLKALSKAGLNDVFTVLQTPSKLSEGQKYRYRLAKAIASGAKTIFADEFCSNLDRITAAVIAYNIHKLAKRFGRRFVLASSHDDLLGDLAADVLVIKHLTGETEVVYRNAKRGENGSA